MIATIDNKVSPRLSNTAEGRVVDASEMLHRLSNEGFRNMSHDGFSRALLLFIAERDEIMLFQASANAILVDDVS